MDPKKILIVGINGNTEVADALATILQHAYNVEVTVLENSCLAKTDDESVKPYSLILNTSARSADAHWHNLRKAAYYVDVPTAALTLNPNVFYNTAMHTLDSNWSTDEIISKIAKIAKLEVKVTN